MVSRPFSTASGTARQAARKASAFSDAILAKATRKNLIDFQAKVSCAWKLARPSTPLSGSQPDEPMPGEGLEELTGFKFKPPIFATFGGCSEDTNALIMDNAKLVAAREGRTRNGVYNRVYCYLPYCYLPTASGASMRKQ